ncbi:MAG: hypothetical protein HZB15_13495, partial [Actinobacteria bacterium]|nr:hypothetical protein [Actinomycetota bacterium]
MPFRSRCRSVGAICLTGLVVLVVVPVVGPVASAELDPTFGSAPGGVVQVDPAGFSEGRAVATLGDGSILAATPGRIVKYTSTGALDTSFGPVSTPGRVELGSIDPSGIAVDGSGDIVVTGTYQGTLSPGDPVAVRVSATGVVDTGFSGSIYPYGFRVSAPIEVGASITVSTYEVLSGEVCLHRLQASDGTLDTGFGTGGHVCTTLPGQVTGVYGRANAGGSYTVFAPFLPSGASASSIAVVDISPAGVVLPPVRTIGSLPAEFILSGRVDSNGRLIVHGEGFVRRYAGESLDPAFGDAGVVHATGMRIEQTADLPDGRLALLGSVASQAQVRLLTADGRPDGALDPGDDTPDRISIPHSTFPGWTADAGALFGATASGGRLVVIGTERDMNGLSTVHSGAVLARTGVIGAADPVAGT